MSELRFVILHRPGPAWQRDRAVLDQPGLQAHAQHYRDWFMSGKLSLGGPFMDAGGGGMMVPAAGLPEAEVRARAESDPAVVSGLLTFELRAWMPALHL
jgi:hypothetical protein